MRKRNAVTQKIKFSIELDSNPKGSNALKIRITAVPELKKEYSVVSSTIGDRYYKK